MLTKHKFWFAKQTHGEWKHVLTVDFCIAELYEDSEYKTISSLMKRERRKFFTQMTEQYGPEGARWSIRWTDWGADVRFRTDADAAGFGMFFTR